MTTYDFTVITVTYNAEQTLERTLRSVGRQTWAEHVEHIIVDGASKDKTLPMAERYREACPHIRVEIISEPDKGLYDAMNKGLARARGRYVVFLNAGDKFHADNTLELVAKAIDSRGETKYPAVVYGETDLVDGEGHFIRHRRLKAPERLEWTDFKWGMLVCHQSFYALREIAPAYDLTYRFSADIDWCIRTMKRGKEMGMTTLNTHRILTDYLAEGMTTANHKASLRERFAIMAHHYGWLTTCLMHAWFVLRAKLKK